MSRIKMFFPIIVLFTQLLFSQQIGSVKVYGFVGHPQEMSNWCWAACIQSLFASKDLEIEQSDIVIAAYGARVNRAAPKFEGTLSLLNRVIVDLNGERWVVRADAGPTYPDAIWLLRKLENDEPVMIWFKDQYQNHAIVVNGGTYYLNYFGKFAGWQTITAYDPYTDEDRIIDASNIPHYVYGTFDVKIEQR